MNNTVVGLFFTRCLLGLIFLMQGYGKVFTYGVNNVYEQFFISYTETFPIFLVQFTAYFTSYTELIGGLFLVLGLFRNYTYHGLALVILIVSFGRGLAQPIWDLQHIFFRSALLIILFLTPQENDKWALDYIITKRKH
ncbi:MAG: DoxX family protein [Vicingaceae bacterium]|nr:DoxX family protein [Vicingaceae bacterium]